jgi:hypothetical protein
MDAAIAPLPDCGICPQFVAYTCVAPISSTLPSFVFLECEENLPARPLMDCAGGFAGENGLDNHGFRERRFMATSNAAASKSGLYADPREHWLALRREEIIDPQRPIVDPHHHLWDRGGQRYLIEEITDDIASGHNIVATVYVDCRSIYRAHGLEAFRPVGEVEFANGVAAMSASGGPGPAAVCAGKRREQRSIIAQLPSPLWSAQPT